MCCHVSDGEQNPQTSIHFNLIDLKADAKAAYELQTNFGNYEQDD